MGLEAEGITHEGKKDTLASIAQRNDTTPMAIYQVVKQYKLAEPALENTAMSAEDIEARLSGTGLGRKSVSLFCEENGIDLQFALDKLARAGIEAGPDSVLKKIGDQYEMTPIELAQAILLP